LNKALLFDHLGTFGHVSTWSVCHFSKNQWRSLFVLHYSLLCEPSFYPLSVQTSVPLQVTSLPYTSPFKFWKYFTVQVKTQGEVSQWNFIKREGDVSEGEVSA
jgi:hypothetical protein